MSDAPIQVCPKDLCAQKRWGKGKVKRTIGAGAGLIFKGSGFYITDYRSESYKKGAQQESGASKSSASESKPKSETKSTGAADSKPAKTASGGKGAS